MLHISDAKYTKAKFDAGCCDSKGNFHRRCICPKISEDIACRSLCSNDPFCKGYAVLQKQSCQLATTTSKCPSGCNGPHQNSNVQKLDLNSRCLVGKDWNGGCFIKGNLSKIWRKNM